MTSAVNEARPFMRRGRDLLGKSVVTVEEGERLAPVRDLIFDPAGGELLALLVAEAGWFRAAQVIPFHLVRSIGEDAVVIGSSSNVMAARDMNRVIESIRDHRTLVGTTLMTTEGDNLGKLADLYFDEHTGQVTGYEVTGGLFADLASGRSYVPAVEQLNLGRNLAFVTPEVARQMEEQEAGGLQGALATAGQRAGAAAGGVADGARGVAEHISDSVRARQKAFVVGHTAASDVTAQDGTLIAPQGMVITAAEATLAERHGALGSLLAAVGAGVFQEGSAQWRDSALSSYHRVSDAVRAHQKAFVVGKTAGRDVTAEDGTVIATEGAPITSLQAEIADDKGVLGHLMASAGGGTAQAGWAATQERVQGGFASIATASREHQKAFVVGKTAHRAVIADDHGLIVAQGGVITEEDAGRAEARGALGQLVLAAGGDSAPGELVGARLVIAPEPAGRLAQTLGRRVQQDVRGPAGSLIAAAGQIVTEAVIHRAQAFHREADLAANVQLDQPITKRLGVTTSQLGDRLAEGAESLRAGTSSLVDRTRSWLATQRDEAGKATEERGIRDALGRPVTRVILNPQDHIVLNVGELVTHKAVAQARQGGVLPILLASVSRIEPHISPLDVRPIEAGEAALNSQEDAAKQGTRPQGLMAPPRA